MARAELGEELVAAHARHDHVGDDHVDHVGGEVVQRRDAVGRGDHFVPRVAKLFLEEESHGLVVLDDQDFR